MPGDKIYKMLVVYELGSEQIINEPATQELITKFVAIQELLTLEKLRR